MKQLPWNVDRALQVCTFMHFYYAKHITLLATVRGETNISYMNY